MPVEYSGAAGSDASVASVNTVGAETSRSSENNENHGNLDYHFELYKQSRDFEKFQETIDQMLAEKKNSFTTATHAMILYNSALLLKSQEKPTKAYRYLRAAILTDLKIVGTVNNDSLKKICSWIERNGTPEEKQFQQLFASFIDGDAQTLQTLLPSIEKQVKGPELQADIQRMKRAHQAMLANSKSLEQAEIDRLRAAQTTTEYDEIQQMPSATSLTLQPSAGRTGSKTDDENEIQRIKARLQDKQFDHNAFLSGGSQLHAFGDLEGARSCFERVMQIKPDLPEGNFRLAKVSRDQGEFTAAMMFAQKAMAANEKEPRYRGLYALILADQGDFARSELEARATIAVDAGNSEARLALALCYLQAEDTENALKHIERGIQSNDTLLAKEFISLKIRLTPIKKPE